VLFAVAIVLFVGFLLLFAVDRAITVIKRRRRRRQAAVRLAAAAAQAEAKDRKRRAAAEASVALTSVIPTIHDHEPRHVD
jgi:hypothetical protein